MTATNLPSGLGVLFVTNTFFQHPNRLLYTSKSPGDVCRNQIDYILVNKRHRNSVKQCRTYPGADIGSDHNPVIASIKIRLKKTRKCNPKKEEIDWGKLSSWEDREKYLVDVKNRFEVLSLECIEQYRYETPNEKIDNKWECLKESIVFPNEKAPKLKKMHEAKGDDRRNSRVDEYKKEGQK